MRKAVVLLSGGLDSTTTLAIAKAEGFEPYALSFRYGQAGISDPLLTGFGMEVAARLPQLDRIDLLETSGCGAVLCWGEQGPTLPV
jgi:hypothetical protein